MEDVFKTLNLSDDNEIFQGIHYNDRTVKCTKIHNYAVYYLKDINV